MYAHVARILGPGAEAEDVVQDACISAWRSIASFEGTSFRAWLFRIAINESRNRFRWWKRRKRDLTISLDANVGESETRFSDTLADNSISPEDTALAREREYAIHTALQDIQEIYREAVILCDIEGLSYDETASALGVGLGTVKSRISRGRDELRRRLKDF